MSFTRIKQRTDTYANWVAQNNNTPGGLKILQGEVLVIIADSASADANLSNVTTDLVTPRYQRLANTGEILGTKVGEGFTTRWDLIPISFPFVEVNYANGTGRVLGTRNNGGTHVYRTPLSIQQAIFGPVYTPPGISSALRDGSNNDLNNAKIEVGQVIAGVRMDVSRSVGTYPVIIGQVFETTSGASLVGPNETSQPPASIGSFSRKIDYDYPTAVQRDFKLNALNASYSGGQSGSGLFQRSFYASVYDSRPSALGGNNIVSTDTKRIYATYPTFFGKSAAALPGDPNQMGAFLQANCSSMLLGRASYPAGLVNYANLERSHFAYPADFGPLRRINNELGSDTMAASFNPPVTALVSKPGQYTNVPYLVYRSKDPGYDVPIVFDFLF